MSAKTTPDPQVLLGLGERPARRSVVAIAAGRRSPPSIHGGASHYGMQALLGVARPGACGGQLGERLRDAGYVRERCTPNAHCVDS